MRIIKECKIDLPPGETIVAMTCHQKCIFVVTDKGTVFMIMPVSAELVAHQE